MGFCALSLTSRKRIYIEYLQIHSAKHRSHLSNENLETLPLLAALKLPAKSIWIWKRNQTCSDKIIIQQFCIFIIFILLLLLFNNICFVILLHFTLIKFWYIELINNLGQYLGSIARFQCSLLKGRVDLRF